MKATIGVLALALLGSPATAADINHLTVGTTLSFHDWGATNRKRFGCYDVENTIEAYRVWSQYGAVGVNRFMRAHDDLEAARDRDIMAGRPRPASAVWRDTCLQFEPAETQYIGGKWEVQQVQDWQDKQLVCLELANSPNFDPTPPGQKRLEEYGPFKPWCWWTILSMPPTIVRR